MNIMGPIFTRFLSIAMILAGALLATRYMKNASPDKDPIILWIAGANIVVGLAVYISGFVQRRNMLRSLEQED